MGSFYSTCSVSHMTLRGEKTSIQLLVPNFYKDFSDSLGMMVSNDGCQMFFSPFGFPIHGEYYDYGQITNIKRDKNVEMLEDFFNLSIEQILDNVGDDRWHRYGEKEGDSHWKVNGKDGNPIKNQKIFLGMAKTYIRTEILEFLQKGYENLLQPKPKKYSSAEFLQKMLHQIDREVSEENPIVKIRMVRKKYNDGEFDNDPKMKADVEELLKHFYDKGLKEFIEKEEEDEYSHYSVRTYIPSLVKTNMFEKLPITTKDFKEDITKQYQFIINFGWKMNRTLLPSNYGSQDTNWAYLNELNTLTNKLLKKNFEGELMDEIYYYMDSKTGEFDLQSFRDDYGYEEFSDAQLEKYAKKVAKDLVKSN